MSGGSPSKVMILGRYNHLQDGLPWSKMKTQFQTLSISFKTVHSAKGMEADYVIVVGLSSGRFGFPSEIEDDPILNLVLSKAEEYDHAEERRLFYVALTRAKEEVHLIADYAEPSGFISEILEYHGLVEGRDAAVVEPIYCPDCETGTMILRSGQYGDFYSCANYPFCEFKSNPCKTCGTGILLKISEEEYTCSNTNCSHTERVCPRCKTGRLVERDGKHGTFIGCTNFAKFNCKYAEKM